MRRLVLPIIVILVALLLLWLPPREDDVPDEGPVDRPSPTAPGADASEPPTPVAVERPTAPPVAPPGGFAGLLYTDGGVPVRGLEVRLELESGDRVASVRSGADGRFVFAPETWSGAPAPRHLHINPERAAPDFDVQRVRIPAERSEDDYYVTARPVTARLDVPFEIRNAVPSAEGGGPIRLTLQSSGGQVHGRTIDPDESQFVFPKRAPGVYAIQAVQGNRAAALPPAALDPHRFPIVLVLERASALVGRVLTPDGQPAAGARVRLRYDATPGRRLDGQYVFIAARDESIHRNHEAVTDAEGVYRIEGLIPVRYAMSVLHGTGSLRREVAVPAAGEVLETPDLTLEADRGRLQIVIARPDDRAAIPAGLQVLVVGYGHRVRREIPVSGAPDEVLEQMLPPDDYAVVLVRSAVAGRGRARITRYRSPFVRAKVKAATTHRVRLVLRPDR